MKYNFVKSQREFREPYDSPNAFQYSKTHYYVLVARLTFFVCFEVRQRKIEFSESLVRKLFCYKNIGQSEN